MSSLLKCARAVIKDPVISPLQVLVKLPARTALPRTQNPLTSPIISPIGTTGTFIAVPLISARGVGLQPRTHPAPRNSSFHECGVKNGKGVIFFICTTSTRREKSTSATLIESFRKSGSLCRQRIWQERSCTTPYLQTPSNNARHIASRNTAADCTV